MSREWHNTKEMVLSCRCQIDEEVSIMIKDANKAIYRVHRVWDVRDASRWKTRQEEEQETFQEGQSQGWKHFRMIVLLSF
jgi:hypothetical protein